MLREAVNIEALPVLDALRRMTDACRALTSIHFGLSEIDALSTGSSILWGQSGRYIRFAPTRNPYSIYLGR